MSAVVCLLVAFSLVTAAVPASGTASTVGGGDAPAVGAATVYQQTSAENNSTVVHENPDNASDSGDLAGTEQWLVDRMTTAIIDCTEQTRLASSYVCSRLDRQYPEWASRYVEVRRVQGVPVNAEANETVTQTGQSVQEFASDVERFRELERQYRGAKASGDTEDARVAAHQLVRQSRRVNQSASRVKENYDAFSNLTSADLTTASQSVVEIENNTTSTANEVRRAELVGTQLSVEATKATGSYTSPLVFEGQLRTAQGDVITDQAVTFSVGNGTERVRTDAEGQFTIEYRPTSERLGEQSLTVAYRPANASLYSGSSDTVPVDIRADDGSMTVSTRSSSVSYNETLTVTGRLTVASQGAADIPVVVSLSGAPVDTVVTNETGGYSLDATVPPDVEAGTARVEAGLPFEGRALTVPDAATMIDVTSTATELTLDAARGNGTVVRIEGRLDSEAGAVADREITLAVNGTVVERARTGRDGRFDTVVDIPPSVTATDPVVVSAAYAAEGQNLDPADARVTLGATGGRTERIGTFESVLSDFRGSAAGQFVFGLGLPEGASGVAAVVLALTGLAVLGTMLTRSTGITRWLANLFSSEDTDDAGVGVEATEPPLDEPDPVPDDSSEALRSARDKLSFDQSDEAIVAGYSVVRARLVAVGDRDASLTHRELLAAADTRLNGSELEAFRRLVEAYERAAFSQTENSTETARSALADAESVLDGLNERNAAGD